MKASKQFTPLRRIPHYLVLCLVSFVAVAPILWMISASLKSPSDILRYPPAIIPEEIRWENYTDVFALQPFAQQSLNSVVIMALVTVLTHLMSIPAGYALARIRPIASGTIFLALLSARVMPTEATIIPLVHYAPALGGVDTQYPLAGLHAAVSNKTS